MLCSPPGSSVHRISQARVLERGSHFLLQGIFPTQGSNPSLQHCRQTLYHLSHQGTLQGQNLLLIHFRVFDNTYLAIVGLLVNKSLGSPADSGPIHQARACYHMLRTCISDFIVFSTLWLISFLKRILVKEFPGGLLVRLGTFTAVVQVQCLVGELRSHKLRTVAKKMNIN